MDSADSGSPKSSTDRDDDYEPRATADFINTHPPPPLFDPFSSYSQHRQTPDNFNISNSNPAWPGSANTQRHSLVNPFGQPFHQQPPPPPPSAGPENTSNAGGSGGAAVRNPRKRSRASRRAPTTVLTTDTTNFRAMVQEFTGIPAPPFSHPSFPRPNRLDNLFGQSRSEAATLPFLRQPFAAPPFLASSTPMINYQQQLPFSASHVINNHNNENPFFSSLLQANPSKFTFSGSSSKPHNRAGPSINIGPGPEEFGLGDATTLNDLPSLISSDRGNGNAAKWRRTGNGNGSDSDNNGVGRSEEEGDRLKSVNGGYDLSGSTSYSFQVEKESGSGLENQAAAGMVESWINSDLQSS